MSRTRMVKAQRRKQLLATAMSIVQERGTEELTLGALADRAGVSRPIVYEHFGTRSGLLVALYAQVAERQLPLLRGALARAAPTLEGVATAIAETDLRCYLAAGPEAQAIAAALKGNAEMESFQRGLIEQYVDVYAEAFARHCTFDAELLRGCCAAFVGAGGALADRVMSGRLTEAQAVELFARLMSRTLAPHRSRSV